MWYKILQRNPLKTVIIFAFILVFGSWSWVSFLLDGIGLFAFLISGFALYSWIFLPQISLASLSGPSNAFKEHSFILLKSKTWSDYAAKRSNEIRQRPPLLLNPRQMRPSSNTSVSSDELHRPDPLIVSKYQKAVGELVLYICRDFIQSWFEKLSPLPTFTFKVESSLWFVFHELTRRFERMDFVQFIIYKILPIFTMHMKEVARAEKLAKGENLRVDDSDLDVLRCYRSGRIHPATSTSPGSSVNTEQNYLRKVFKPIIPLLLPKLEGDVKIICVLLREILVCKVIQPIIESIADPDFWNQMFDRLAEKLMLDYSLDKKVNDAIDKLERSDDELETLLNRPPSFDNFIKQIKKCDNLLDALGIRDTIHSEIIKKKTEIAGCGGDDIINGVRVSDIRIYINRLHVAEKRVDKRIKALGGKTLKIISNNDANKTPPSLIDTLDDPHLLSSFVDFMDKDGRLPYLQLYMILTGIEEQVNLQINPDDNSWIGTPDQLLINDLKKVLQDFFLDKSIFIDIDDKLAADFETSIKRLDDSKSLNEQSLEWFQLLKRVKMEVLRQMELDFSIFVKSSTYKNQSLNIDIDDEETAEGLSFSDRYRMILEDKDKFKKFKVSNLFKKSRKDTKGKLSESIPSRKDAVENVEGELQSIIASDEKVFSTTRKGFSSKARYRKNSTGGLSSDSENGLPKSAHARRSSFTGNFFKGLSRSTTEPAFDTLDATAASITPSRSNMDLKLDTSGSILDTDQKILKIEQELRYIDEEIRALTKEEAELKSTRQLVLMKKGLEAELEQVKGEKILMEKDSKDSLFKGGIIIKMPEARTVKEDGKHFTVYPIEVIMQRPYDTFPASWTIQRRYSEFEALHTKLKNTFSPVSQLEFPGKMLKGLMQMTTQLTDARRRGLEKYLRALLQIPDVRNNQDFIKFLCSDDILKRLLLSSKPRPLYDSNDLLYEGAESYSILELTPVESYNSHPSPNILNSSLSPSVEFSISATDAVIDLFIELFELKERNNWLRHQAVVILLQQMFGGTVERRVTENLGWAGDLGTAVNLLEWILNYLWPNGTSFYDVPTVIRTSEQKKKTRSDSLSKLASIFPEIFGGMVGRSNAKRGAERLLWLFQNKRLNQQLLYMLADELIASLFSELKK